MSQMLPPELLQTAVVEWIPAGLDTMEPGLVLGAMLASIDIQSLSGGDRLVVLRAQQRQVSHLQARQFETMEAVVDAVADELDIDTDSAMGQADAAEAAAAEIRVALGLTRRCADRELDMALELRRRLPAVYAALQAGSIDRRRAGVIVYETTHLPIVEAQTVTSRVLGDAPQLTTGQLRARLQRLCMETDPDAAKDRYETAVTQRRVTVEATTDGTAHLYGLDLAPDRVAEIRHRIDAIARSLRTNGEARTMDQLRADVYLDLLTGTAANGSKNGSKGVIDLRVDVETLTGMTDTPGELGGYGPVIADIARQIALNHPDAEWRFTLTDTGQPVATGTTRRRPTATQRRAIETRDQTCVFPGCRMPAITSDLDHTTPYAKGGATTVDAMAPLCRHDHCLRHQYGWTYTRLPNGDYQWTSPLGHTTIVPAARAP